MIRRMPASGLAVILMLALGLPHAAAVEEAVEQAVQENVPESGSPVDSALSDSVWYDADQGELVPVAVKPQVDDSLNRESRWLPKAKRVEKTAAPTTNTGGGGATGATGLFGSGLTLTNLFGWLLLIAIIAAAITAFAYALSRTEVDLISGGRRSNSKSPSTTPDQQMIERMKHLPAELRRTDVNLRSEAERLMNQGEYDQAIILLFGHQLLLLDRVSMLRLNRGKTNRKYVRETRAADPDTAKRLQATVTAFERSYFGATRSPNPSSPCCGVPMPTWNVRSNVDGRSRHETEAALDRRDLGVGVPPIHRMHDVVDRVRQDQGTQRPSQPQRVWCPADLVPASWFSQP